jgi:hypothetical protein
MRIFMIETNGLPNLSDGATPDIKSLDYGIWATEIFDKLDIGNAFIAGASASTPIHKQLNTTNEVYSIMSSLVNGNHYL